MTSSNTNQLFVDASNSAYKIAENYKKRKATKERRRKSKYAGKKSTKQVWKAYNWYDNGSCPEHIMDDVYPDYLQQLMDGL